MIVFYLIFILVLNLIQIFILKQLHKLNFNKWIYLAVSLSVSVLIYLSDNEMFIAAMIGVNFLAVFGIAILAFLKSSASLKINIIAITDRIIGTQERKVGFIASPALQNAGPIFHFYVIFFCLYEIFFTESSVESSYEFVIQSFGVAVSVYLSISYLVLKSTKLIEKGVEKYGEKNGILKIRAIALSIITAIFLVVLYNLVGFENLSIAFNFQTELSNLSLSFLGYLFAQIVFFITNPFAYSVQTIGKTVLLFQTIFMSIFVTVIICLPIMVLSEINGFSANPDPLFLLGFNVTILIVEYYMRKENRRIAEQKAS